MTAKAWGEQERSVDEIFCQNEAVSLCMLVNRRTRTMRVVDFRAGPTTAKRAVALSVARREGVRKVFTVVERDEVANWLKLGFAKEGNIPGFYKRSDAFLLGCPAAGSGQTDDDAPMQSETRIVAARPVSGGAAPSEAHALMDRTLTIAKRALKDEGEKQPPRGRVWESTDVDARKAAAAALRTGRALTAFEPFGRDVERRYFRVTSRSGLEVHASVELQACFGNAYVELLHAPRTDAEGAATSGALAALAGVLEDGGVISCFSLAPVDDVGLAVLFLRNGFRRTGLLLDHLVVGGKRKDAILWSRKLANPGDE